MITAIRQNGASAASSSGAQPPSVLLCTPVWGTKFVRVFCDLVLPTLLAPGNLPVFAGRMECVFLIYTSHDSEALLRASSSFQKLASLLEVRLHFIEDLTGADKYGTLTACYNDAIRIGAEHRQGLVFLNADMVYSRGTFASIMKRIDQGKRCIEVDGFRTKKQGMEADLRREAGDIIDIPPSELVGLALKHIHSISQSHLWEAEADGGFIPFHTYWRAGKYGLVGKISHLYPLYLYPREWDDLNSAKTIDWDLIDRAGLRSEDIHLVLDSEELFVAELSDEDYHIPPTYPSGGTVGGMREFIAAHCAPHHRDCLKYSSRLQVKSGGRFSWWWAELKAFTWYKAVCEQSKASSIALWFFGLLIKMRRLPSRVAEAVSLVIASLGSLETIANNPRLLEYLMGRDPRPYLALMQAAPTNLRSELRGFRLPVPFGRSRLRRIDDEYERICLGENSPIPMSLEHDFVLLHDAFFGIGWRIPENYPARKIGRDGSASIFVQVPQGRAYRAVVGISEVPFDLGMNLLLEVNGELLLQQIVELSDLWRVSGVIPASALGTHEGRIKLTVRLSDKDGNPCGDVFTVRVHIAAFPSVQESVLEQHGLSASLYAAFRNSSEEYRQRYDDCSPELEWDHDRAQSWVSALHNVLSSKVLPSQAAQVSEGGDIAIAGQIPGYGWGNSGTWGSQSYRWLGGSGSSSLFLKFAPGRSYLVKVYLHTCPKEALDILRLDINKDPTLSQGLQWENDRYFLWIDVPARVTVQSGGLVELSISVGAGDINPERLTERRRLRHIFKEALSFPPTVNFANTAVSRLLVVEHDMIATKAEVLALELKRH